MKIKSFVLLLFFSVQTALANDGLHTPAFIEYLTAMSAKTSLTEPERAKIRETMLNLMNEARKNPEYRKKQGSKTALTLPSSLTPFVLDDRLNYLAQQQSDYQANLRRVTHANRNFRKEATEPVDYHGISARFAQVPQSGPEACGGSSKLQEFPIGWMKSETHYRPTWNLDGDKSTAVGFGMAKGSDGFWYATAVWGSFDITTAVNVEHRKNLAQAPPPPAVYQGPFLKPGDKLTQGQKLMSQNNKYQLRENGGDFTIEEVSTGKVISLFPLSGGGNGASGELRFNPDGNVCISSKKGHFCATDGRDPVANVLIYKGKKAILTNEGKFVVLNETNQEIWRLVPSVLLTKNSYILAVNNSDLESEKINIKAGEQGQVMDYKQETNHRYIVKGHTYSVLKINSAILPFFPDFNAVNWINTLKNAGNIKVIQGTTSAINPYNALSVTAYQKVANGPIQLTYSFFQDNEMTKPITTLILETKGLKWPQ
jgi:hypothetical protein